jgi:hypothetical protein
LHIAATTGNILSTDGLVNRRRAVVTAPAPAPPPPVAAPAPRYDPEPEERPAPRGLTPGIQRASDEANQFFERVGNHMQRRGRQIGDVFHNLFTGDRRNTAGPHGTRSGPTPLPPRANDDTDYVRPSRVRD